MPERRDAGHEVVLVADGDVLVRNAVADYLRECGYRSIEAADADEVVTVLSETSLRIDVLLASADLGGGLGIFDLARRAVELRPGLDVILTGAYDSAAAKAADLCDQGPQLGRPYDHVELVRRIRARLADRDRSARD